MSSSPNYKIKIEKLAHGGDGLGRLPDGRAIFVPFALPGELLRVRLTEERKRFTRGKILEILEPAQERTVPRCPHFTQCGGCQMQHMDYSAQIAAKEAILVEQLERLGGLSPLPNYRFVPSPIAWNYRNRIQFSLDEKGNLGFNYRHSKTTLSIKECHLPEPAINIIWPQLDFEAIPDIEHVTLRQGIDEDIQLILESSSPLTPEMTIEKMSLSAVHLSPAGQIVIAGSDSIWMSLLGQDFRVSAGSFFQVNTAVAATIVSDLLNFLPLDKIDSATDIFCGVGLFSKFIAPFVSRLAGIEVNPYAANDFVVNLDNYDHIELYEAPAEIAIHQIAFHPDLVIVDPPRAGLQVAVIEGIAKLASRYLVYISCDPATLARDCKALNKVGYTMVRITGLDMFPQTSHIESISYWIQETR